MKGETTLKRLIILLVLVGTVFAVSPSIVMADHDDIVNATVTPSSVSISIASPNIGYGTLHLAATGQEPTDQVCSNTSAVAAFTVTNNGTGNQDFTIAGAASTPGSWTLAGSAGANTYVHRFTDDPIATCVFTALTGSPQTLRNTVAQSASVPTFLQLDMPTSSGSGAEQTLPITITATAS